MTVEVEDNEDCSVEKDCEKAMEDASLAWTSLAFGVKEAASATGDCDDEFEVVPVEHWFYCFVVIITSTNYTWKIKLLSW